MKKEVPLSLQVFHSNNEYKAHRRNRTEQLRLDDVRTVLQREQKLYVKEHELHKTKFNASRKTTHHYPNPLLNSGRRNSLSSSSFRTPSVFSQVSVPTVYSAPAKLQRKGSNSSNPVLQSALAAQLCNSLSRLTTSTRFQRIQRQFSLASFTKNGLITRKGMNMTRNISKAREVLSRRKPLFSDVGTMNYSSASKRHKFATAPQGASERNQNGRGDDVTDDEQIEEEDDDENNNNNRQNDIEVQVRNTLSQRRSASEGDSTNIVITTTYGQEAIPGGGGSLNLHGNEIDQVDSPSPRPRGVPPRTPKKRVTIKPEVEIDTIPDIHEDNRLSPLGEFDTYLRISSKDEDLNDWSSIFSRPSTAPKTNPLQEKINSFLKDQMDFNKAFPGRREVRPEVDDIQKELTDRAKARTQMKNEQTKKKNEIVVEVLNTLGVTDPHIMAHYDIEPPS